MKVYGLVRLAKEPEYNNGCTRLSIAWNDFKREGHFFNAVAFKKTGEAIYNNCKKGDRIVITQGILANNNYVVAGEKKYGEQIIINQFEFIESKGNVEPHMPVVAERKAPTIDINSDIELPF